eukprot:gene26344-17442_t
MRIRYPEPGPGGWGPLPGAAREVPGEQAGEGKLAKATSGPAPLARPGPRPRVIITNEMNTSQPKQAPAKTK